MTAAVSNFVQTFVDIEQLLSEKHGDFVLFALFLREDALDRWDVVVSAPWLHEGSLTDLRLLAKPIQDRLSSQDVVRVSRIAIVDPDSQFVEEIIRTVQTEHRAVERGNQTFFEMPMRQAVIVTSRPVSLVGR